MKSGVLILSRYKLYYNLINKGKDHRLKDRGKNVFKKFKVKVNKG